MSTFLMAGDKAPLFTGKDGAGTLIKLSSLRGQRLALYFYPADDTPTCTIQACNLRDNFSTLQQAGILIIGVSPDTETDHSRFSEKYSLPFPLIADTGLKICKLYGVWGPKQLYGRQYEGVHRTTFLIDEKGIIKKIFLRPKNKMHAAEIIEYWG